MDISINNQTNKRTKTNMRTNAYEKLADVFESAIDSQVEYATEHEDAGGNYSHMPREGGWAYSGGPKRLLDWCDANGIETTKEELELIEDEILDWCDIEPGHIFSNVEGSGKFLVDSYPVGEVEDQYSLPDLTALLETSSEEETLAFVALAMDDNRFCLRANGDGGVLSYTNTDAVWNFVIDREWIKSHLEDVRETA